MESVERWQRVKVAFNQALDLAAEARDDFLRSLVEDDPELAKEVASLLESHDSTDPFLENSAVVDLAAQAVADSRRGFGTGEELGPYRIDGEIGRGGMGEVYRATRFSDFEQQVAIKVVRSSLRDEALRRFLDERQILARLEHPNIARLLDGGTAPDGTPYLVMEAIRGEPIDRYCHEHRLPVAERVALLRTVCEAVHYAHQNLVVHRDLKPSNILVTPEGVPKLLDFGIAKLIDPDHGRTESWHDGDSRRRGGPMTPQYASPEQLRGDAVSTASDIYSLGVLAYRLLASALPYRVDTEHPLELLRAVFERRPEKPSTLVAQRARAAQSGDDTLSPSRTGADAQSDETREPTDTTAYQFEWSHPESPDRLSRHLEGDLDAIVLRALRKEPSDRYASLAAMADDLGRYLDGQPVEARGRELGYLFRKWVVRHRAAVAGVLLLLLAVVAGVAATVRQAAIAERQRAAAERRFEELRELTNTFLFDFHDAVAPLPGSTAVRQRMVSTAREYLERLAAESAGDSELETELAMAWMRLGDVQGERGRASLGDTAQALESYGRSLALFDGLLAAGTEGVAGREIERQWAVLHRRVGELRFLQGNRDAAADHHRQGLERLEALVVEHPDDRDLQLELARSLARGAQIDIRDERFDVALTTRERALRLVEDLGGAEGVAADDADPEWLAELATAHVWVGDVHELEKRFDDALTHFGEALDIDRRMILIDPLDAEQRHRLLSSHARLGTLLRRLERFGEALGHLQSARVLGEELVAADPFDARSRRSLLLIRQSIAGIYQSQGRQQEALELFRQLVLDAGELADLDPSSARAERDVAVAHYRLGLALEAEAGVSGSRQQWQDARAAFEASLEIFLALGARGALEPRDDHAAGELRDCIARCDAALGG